MRAFYQIACSLWFDYDRTMKTGPNISQVAALIGDPARSNMLLALMDGRALTASELANAAGVTKQTASSHLSKMLDADLVRREVQGRHHYYRLSDPDVADAIEALLNVASRGAGHRTRTGPKDPALRKARICYDHLAGELGVLMFDRFQARGWLSEADGELGVSEAGWLGLSDIQLAPNDLPKTRRPECKTCLDWSMRRHHLAGKIGNAVLDRMIEMNWAKRLPNSRIIAFSASGERAFRDWLR